MNIVEQVYSFLESKKLALVLFILLALILIPGTLSEDTSNISLGIPGTILFALLSLNLSLCTLRRFKTLSKSVLVLHVGTLLTFTGAAISTLGYVATVNIYEGTSVDKVYRWDIEKDTSIGVDIKVKKINIDYYSFPVKVGVLRGEEKEGLYELMTGESFHIDGYDVQPETVEFPSLNMKLNITRGGDFVGIVNTEGQSSLPPDFPFQFKLVAYKNPPLKRLWVDLELIKDSEVVAEGTSEVNSPLSWGKLNFYNTQIDVDEYGQPYAGIQITNDPGVPIVYTGFIILGIGSLMYMYRRLHVKK